jgi:hypothetical protein
MREGVKKLFGSAFAFTLTILDHLIQFYIYIISLMVFNSNLAASSEDAGF